MDQVEDMDEWEYRGEGNHNVVIANTKKSFVYRLAKRYSVAIGAPVSSEGNKQELVELEDHFVENICNKIINKTARDIKYCPEHAGQLIYPLALKLPDFCFPGDGSANNHYNQENIPTTITVEIKPSVLFIGSGLISDIDSGDISEKSLSSSKLASLRQHMCRHCFTNKVKAKRGIWQKASQSCPLDLVSGDKDRMKFALSDLFDNPHHRLKIYKNGHPIFSRETEANVEDELKPLFGFSCENKSVSPRDHLIEVVITALMSSPPEGIISSCHDVINGSDRSDCNIGSTETKVLEQSKVERLNKGRETKLILKNEVNSSLKNGMGDITTTHGDLQELHSVMEDSCVQRSGSTSFSQQTCNTKLQPLHMDSSALVCPDYQLISNETHHKALGVCSASPFLDVPCSTPGVPRGCVLDVIRRAQMFGDLSILSVYPYYLKLARHFKAHPLDRRKYCMDGPYDTEAWLSVIRDPYLLKCIDKSSIQYAIKKVQQFLIYLAIKGSSIMIAIQPIQTEYQSNQFATNSSPTFMVNDQMNRKFKVSISVIDLDPKPIEKIQRMFARDQEDAALFD